MAELDRIEQTVRSRLRTIRLSQGRSLDDVAGRAGLSPSTLSRIETGKRTISLDVLVPLASALHVDVATLLAVDDGDVVIRPTPHRIEGDTVWTLSRSTSGVTAVKMRLRPTRRPVEQRVHPGRDWFFVLEGRVVLHLGDRQVAVELGEAAEFDTMTPHAISAVGGVAEVVMLFDREGQRVHVHAGT